MNRIKNYFIKLWTGVDANIIAKNKNSLNDQNKEEVRSYDEKMNEVYLFDFKNYMSQYSGYHSEGIMITGGSNSDGNSEKKALPQKIKMKPIDALMELEKEPSPFSLIMLDEKISMLKDKVELINQHYAKREVEALIERIENRKKYNDFKDYFAKYQSTTDEKIDKLLGGYELVMKSSDIFIPEFPDEAINKMKEYTEKMKAICGKKPIFYVIAEADKFHEAYKKRDPILLAQSPFGFYYYILGAWSDEMLLLSEL